MSMLFVCYLKRERTWPNIGYAKRPTHRINFALRIAFTVGGNANADHQLSNKNTTLTS